MLNSRVSALYSGISRVWQAWHVP